MTGRAETAGQGLRADLALARGGFTLEVDLAVAPGQVVALLGPNGAGKSTVLRLLAGLLTADRAEVTLAGRTLSDTGARVQVPPHERGTGMVFQDYLLFPHLSLLDNVAFGLRARQVGRAEARRRAAAWLDRVGLASWSAARPRAVSGGQAQRAALARALAVEPDLLLLDEPLAALDARTRLTVRGELRRHLADFPGAALVVTHDPVDAMVLADRLVVLEAGRVVQAGAPADVARHPRTDYVARLVGLNLLAGVADGTRVRLATGGEVVGHTATDGPVHVAFRPAAVALYPTRPGGSPRNAWRGRIRSVEPYADGVRVEVAGAPDPASAVLAEVSLAAVAELDVTVGREVWASLKAAEVEVYPRG